MPRYATVLLDCDSTLSAIEGIDELAAACGADVRSLTDAAMRGEIPLEAIYGRRLDLVRPSKAQLETLAQLYVERLVPDAASVVAALQRAGVDVRIISGGLLPAVLAVGRAVGLAREQVAAVDVYFDEHGQYVGYDEASPLTRVGGKCAVIVQWHPLPTPVMMVGDGTTDLETRPLVNLFVAYAGVIARDVVVRSADVTIRSASLAPLLPLALGADAPSDAESRELYDRGAALQGIDRR
jgi:phosphoserine phosphatase